MQELVERLRAEGAPLGRGLLKVDSFLNHQVDPALMVRIGQDLARHFTDQQPNKVLTAETGGIAPALLTALALNVPLVIARKSRSQSMPRQPLRESTLSAREERVIELFVSPEFLKPGDRVLLVDDILSSPQELLALARLIHKAGGHCVGAGIVVEKTFEHGREALEHLGLSVYSLVRADKTEDGQFALRD